MGISVLVFTYNNHKYLAECLSTVVPELREDDELILLDDASDPPFDFSEFEHLKGVLAFELKIYQSKLNLGTNNLIIASRHLVSKAFVKFIAGDDYFQKGWRFEMESVISSLNGLEVAYGPVIINGTSVGSNSKFLRDPSLGNLLRYKGCIFAPSVIMPREALSFINQDFDLIEDKPLWVNLLLSKFSFRYYQEAIVHYRIHNDSVQSNKGIPTLRYLNDRIKYLKIQGSLSNRLPNKILIWVKIIFLKFVSKNRHLLRNNSFVIYMYRFI